MVHRCESIFIPRRGLHLALPLVLWSVATDYVSHVHVLWGQAVVVIYALEAWLDCDSIVVHVSLEVRVIEGRARALDHFLHRHVASILVRVLLRVLAQVMWAAPDRLTDSIRV